LGINRPNGLNCHNLKVWGGVKCHILNFGSKSENGWILQGVKCNFPKKKQEKSTEKEREINLDKGRGQREEDEEKAIPRRFCFSQGEVQFFTKEKGLRASLSFLLRNGN
jgi:hypothetical protein